MKSTNNPLQATHLLDGLNPEETQLYHSVTNEPCTEVALNPERTTTAQIFNDGCVIVTQGGFCVSLDGSEAERLASAISGHSRDQHSPYERIAKILKSEEDRRQFLEDTAGDDEYNAYLEHKATPSAENY